MYIIAAMTLSGDFSLHNGSAGKDGFETATYRRRLGPHTSIWDLFFQSSLTGQLEVDCRGNLYSNTSHPHRLSAWSGHGLQQPIETVDKQPLLISEPQSRTISSVCAIKKNISMISAGSRMFWLVIWAAYTTQHTKRKRADIRQISLLYSPNCLSV